MYNIIKVSLILFISPFVSCMGDDDTIPSNDGGDPPIGYIFGADLSYLNQIIDKGGIFKEDGIEKNAYAIFSDNGTNLVRLRIWNNPTWTKTVYSPPGTDMYNDLFDVERSIKQIKENNMATLLDFHYSDEWADPGKQLVPAAWLEIRDIEVLKDSVYNFTYKTLIYLNDKGLMPEYVQIGNETNCGMLYSDAPEGFPDCNGCIGEWSNLRAVLSSAIKAVRDVETKSQVDTKIILHVADPKNVDFWFDNVMISGEINDFDIIGFSYYPSWHSEVTLSKLSGKVAGFKVKYNKDIMILETAYPWTTANNDNYPNIFSSSDAIEGFSIDPESQLKLMKMINQKMIDGGGIGTIYWEPGWITSNLKDLWGTGSSWENNTFFDYDGNLNHAIEYMNSEYK